MKGLLRRQFRYTYANYTLILIMLNVFVYLLTSMNRRVLIYLAMIPGIVVENGYIWQVFTYMFAHANFSHLLFNMIGLFFFGTQIERRMGSREFLFFYLLTGTLAGIFSFFLYLFSGGYSVILLGASGAVFAVLFAFAVFFPHARIFVFGILPVRAPILVIAYTAIELFSQFSRVQTGVAHLTHLAGFAFAFLYFRVRLQIDPIDTWKRSGRGPWG